MAFDLAYFLPESLSVWVALALMALSFAASALTAMFGLGGGIAMLAALGVVFPPAVVVPVHGCVQLGSNAGRAIVQRLHIQWNLVLWFGLGTLAGALAGGQIALALPESLFRLAIGVFILFSVWGPQPRVSGRGPVANLAAGAVIGAIGMIVGAVGPLVANFLRALEDRRQLIATHALLLVLNNAAKVAAFTLFGFAFASYVPLVLAMVATGFLGTLVGSRFLDRLPEAGFRKGFRIVLTLLALEMLRVAVFG